jgi:ABC-type proline/glycine betaine transport system substrate-binding protein
MKIWRLICKAATATLIALAVFAAPMTSYAGKGTLKMHEADWTGHLVFGKLMQILLEEHLDYKAKLVFMPGGAGAWHALAAGDLDIGFETWPNYNIGTKETYVPEFGGDGSIVYVTKTGVVGSSDYWVPRYVIEGDAARGIKAVAPDLKSWKDLNKYKDLFATPETGDRGRLIGCPTPAWDCQDQARLDALGIDFQAVELGTDTASWAELESVYSRGEPILIYAWTPMWVFAKYDLVGVGLPENTDGKCWPACGWATDVTFHIARKGLKEDAPDAYALLENLHMSNDQQAPMIYDVDVTGMSVEEAVRKWMASNESTWRAMLP